MSADYMRKLRNVWFAWWVWGQLVWKKFVASYNPLFWFFLVIKVWFGGALISATVQSKRMNWTVGERTELARERTELKENELNYCAANHIVTISRKNKLYSELPVKVPKLTRGEGGRFLRLFFIASLRYSKFKSN